MTDNCSNNESLNAECLNMECSKNNNKSALLSFKEMQDQLHNPTQHTNTNTDMNIIIDEASNSDEENCNLPYCPKCSKRRLRRSSSPSIYISSPTSSPRRDLNRETSSPRRDLNRESCKDTLEVRSKSLNSLNTLSTLTCSQSSLITPTSSTSSLITSSDTSDEISTDNLTPARESSKSSPNVFTHTRKISESQKKLIRSESPSRIPAIEDEICSMQMSRSQKIKNNNDVLSSRLRTNSVGDTQFPLENEITIQRKTSESKTNPVNINGDEVVCIKKLQKQRFREVVQHK